MRPWTGRAVRVVLALGLTTAGLTACGGSTTVEETSTAASSGGRCTPEPGQTLLAPGSNRPVDGVAGLRGIYTDAPSSTDPLAYDVAFTMDGAGPGTAQTVTLREGETVTVFETRLQVVCVEPSAIVVAPQA